MPRVRPSWPSAFFSLPPVAHVGAPLSISAGDRRGKRGGRGFGLNLPLCNLGLGGPFMVSLSSRVAGVGGGCPCCGLLPFPPGVQVPPRGGPWAGVARPLASGAAAGAVLVRPAALKDVPFWDSPSAVGPGPHTPFWGGALSGTALRGGRCRGGRRARGGAASWRLGFGPSPPVPLGPGFSPPQAARPSFSSFRVHCWGRGRPGSRYLWGFGCPASEWFCHSLVGHPFPLWFGAQVPPGLTLHLRGCGLGAPIGHSSVGGGA